MNLGEGREAVKDRGFDYLSTGRLDLMLNAAKDAFEDYWEWPWLQAWLIAQPTPLALSDLKLIQTVKATATGQELLGLDPRQLMQGGTDWTAPGSPEYWWVHMPGGATWLHVWPGDGATVDLMYLIESPPLTKSDDTPLIPARYHNLWIDLAVCEAYKDSDNFPAAQALRGDVGLRMQDVITRYETRNRQHSPFMTVRGYSEDD